MRSQGLSGDKSRILAYDGACMTPPRVACFSFAQHKTQASGVESRAEHPFTSACRNKLSSWVCLFTVNEPLGCSLNFNFGIYRSFVPIIWSVCDTFVSCRIFCRSIWKLSGAATHLYDIIQVWRMQPRFRSHDAEQPSGYITWVLSL